MVSKKWGGGGGCQRNTPLKASLQKVRLPLADSNFKLISKFSLNNSLDGMFWRDHARFLMRVLLALICKSPPQGLDGSFKCQFQTGRSGVELSIMVGFYKDGSRMIFFDNLVGLATLFSPSSYCNVETKVYIFFLLG